MRWDGWEFFGLLGEVLFFARLVAQWAASEREGKPVIPAVYWILSLAGAGILILYALHLGSFPVLIPQIVGVVFYARGIQLDRRARAEEKRRRALGFDSPGGDAGYAWPKISVIVPVHNEEAGLAQTLAPLLAQRYPGPQPEIIAALNGCTDNSKAVAASFAGKITTTESPLSGMSFGKNLGARAATGDFLVFVDADTSVPPNALRLLAEAAAGKPRFIGTVAGAPDRGGPVVRICFVLANIATRRKRAHAPGGVMLMDRATFDAVGGFDESLPQGTSTDCIRRALDAKTGAGAEYVFVGSFRAATSIRRFEKRGIIRQMLDWRRNHRAFAAGRHADVAARRYEDIR